MYIEKATADFGNVKVHVNASWITLRDSNGAVLFDRNPHNDDWYDASHKRIVAAIEAFEKAIRAAVKSNAPYATASLEGAVR